MEIETVVHILAIVAVLVRCEHRFTRLETLHLACPYCHVEKARE